MVMINSPEHNDTRYVMSTTQKGFNESQYPALLGPNGITNEFSSYGLFPVV